MATVTTTLIAMGTIAGVIVACLLLAFLAFTAHGRVIGSEARLLQGLPGSAEDASASSGSVCRAVAMADASRGRVRACLPHLMSACPSEDVFANAPFGPIDCDR
jgi:hypothetical protein